MAVEENLSSLLGLSNRLNGAMGRGLKRGGDLIKDLGSQLAPKDTEELANSGQVEQKSDTQVEVSFGNGIKDGRAPAQEFGTSDMPAQPYLTPAANEIDVAAEVADEIRKALT